MSKENDEGIWNFAFGSNMSSKVLEGRRKIKPMEKVAGKVKGWRVSFFPMVPYIEPGMGTIERYEGATCHGVLVKLSPKEWDDLYASEGGGKDGGYKLAEIECEAYDGRKIKAYAFESKERPSFVGYPSQRYMNLLLDGAREYKLDEDYIKELEAIPVNTTSTCTKFMVFPFFAPIMIPVMFIMLTALLFKRFFGIRVPVPGIVNYSKNISWFLHDYFLKFIFGDGGKWFRK
eukprot:gene10028-2347_t